MKAAPFSYHDPQTLSDAIGLLALDNAKLLAGGQSLVPMLNMRFALPDHVIDLNRVSGLSGIRREGDAIEIGAMTRQCELVSSPEIAASLPIFGDALQFVGHFQTRTRGTIGGSLCHLDPSAELPALILLMDADLKISGRGGERSIAPADWFQGFMQPAISADEVLTAIRIAPWEKGHGYGFSEFSRRHGDYAIAGAAALLSLNRHGRIAKSAISVFGVEVSPKRLSDAEKMLAGAVPSAEAFRDAASAAAKLDAMEDSTASAAYRKKLAVVMVRRALAMAQERAEGMAGE